MAANHWPLAVSIHQDNHPDSDHDCADISQVDPRRYRKTDMLWASPSCTKHSIARGKASDPTDVDAERSRATMWDVQRFAEHHDYRYIFVENVCEVRKWVGFRAWWIAHEDLGYCMHEVFHNAAFAGQLGDAAAQWRDRWFCMMHPKGTKCPDLDRWISPDAWCSNCERVVSGYQWWKNPAKQAGKYKAQYLFKCRECRNVVEPITRQASEVIDWSLPAQRIGDRAKPLAEKTLKRVQIGLDRYGSALIPVEGRDGKQPFPLDAPMRTLTGRNETALMTAPFIAELRGGNSTTRAVSEPLATVTASGNHHALVVPYYSTGTAHPTSEPLGTVTTVDRFGLAKPQGTAVEDCSLRMLQPEEYAQFQGFPADYQWRGSKRDRVRLAGNAVPTNMARDLVGCAVESMA